MKARIWSRRSASERKLPRLSNLRTRRLSQISTGFIKASMLRGVREHPFVRRVMQKGRAALHRLENTALAFHAQALGFDAFLFGHPTYHRFGLMDVQILQHDAPLRRLGLAFDQVLEMGQGILFGARRAKGWLNHLSGDDIEIDEPGQRPMPDVFELSSQDMTWLHGQVRRLA